MKNINDLKACYIESINGSGFNYRESQREKKNIEEIAVQRTEMVRTIEFTRDKNKQKQQTNLFCEQSREHEIQMGFNFCKDILKELI